MTTNKIVPIVPDTIRTKVLHGLEGKRLSLSQVMKELDKLDYNTKKFSMKQKIKIVNDLL
jgi:hypothetical protein